MLYTWHFGELRVTGENPLNAHTLKFFTLFHTQLLHDSHVNIGYLIAKIPTNLTRNKTNTWLNKFNLTTLYVSLCIP